MIALSLTSVQWFQKSNLQILHLDSNGVVEVAVGSLGMLYSVRELSLSKNKIKLLPDDMVNLLAGLGLKRPESA